MTPVEEPVRERLARVVDRIGRAAARAGRRAEDVRLVAVSKTQPTARLVEAYEAGARTFGENYVQEAAGKVSALPGAEWHLIGRLQRNKAAKAVSLFSWIESVDSARLLEEVSRRAEAAGRVVPVLLEVNLAGEGSKGGVTPGDLARLIEAAAGLRGVSVRGLMAIPPVSGGAEASRPWFARLRGLLEGCPPLPGGQRMTELSMGMSNDFEAAIEEGATMVRVGTAIFGSRG